jgi:hypothetical protein
MIRYLLVAGLAAALLWVSDGTTPAQDAKAPAAQPAQPPSPGSSGTSTSPATPGALSPQTQKINEFIAKGWSDAGIKKPADKASDFEYLRRVFVDLLGRIPTVEEIIDFEKDTSANKRVKMVQRVLYEKKYTPKRSDGRPVTEAPGLRKVPIDYSAQYARNFAEIWSAWLLTRSGVDEVFREQLMTWVEEQFDTNVPYRDYVTALITATGKSNENGSVHFVFRHLGDPIRPQGNTGDGQLTEYGKWDAIPITSRVTRLFLGIQTQCTQCHDHPHVNEWKQEDFWSINVFFRQTEKGQQKTQSTMNNKKATNLNYVELKEETGWDKEGLVLFQRRDGRTSAADAVMLPNLAQAFDPKFDRKKNTKRLDAVPQAGKTRRQILAAWVIQHDNFEAAFVNRMWGHLFGRGLSKEPTVDDFKSDNDVIHPELLAYLAEEFKKSNHDVKKLLEWICTSDVYQLSHVSPKGLTDPKYAPYFAYMPLKAMSPEVLFDSLALATRVETRLSETEYRRIKGQWTRQLVRNFGDDEGNELSFNGTVVQALLMMNGKDINDQIGRTKDQGVVAEVVKKHKGQPEAIYNELFMMTVSRHPTRTEVLKLEEVRLGRAVIDLGTPASPTPPKKGGPPPKGTTTVPPKAGPQPVPGAAPDDVQFYQDVFWALLNTNEFMLNH